MFGIYVSMVESKPLDLRLKNCKCGIHKSLSILIIRMLMKNNEIFGLHGSVRSQDRCQPIIHTSVMTLYMGIYNVYICSHKYGFNLSNDPSFI